MHALDQKIGVSEGAYRHHRRVPTTGAALAQYVAEQWPTGRRKMVMNTWDLSVDEARKVCEGRASRETIDKIWAADARLSGDRGGYRAALACLALLTGKTLEQWLAEQIERQERELDRRRDLLAEIRATRALNDDEGDAPQGLRGLVHRFLN